MARARNFVILFTALRSPHIIRFRSPKNHCSWTCRVLTPTLPLTAARVVWLYSEVVFDRPGTDGPCCASHGPNRTSRGESGAARSQADDPFIIGDTRNARCSHSDGTWVPGRLQVGRLQGSPARSSTSPQGRKRGIKRARLSFVIIKLYRLLRRACHLVECVCLAACCQRLQAAHLDVSGV